MSTNIPLTVDATKAGLPAGTPVYMYVIGLVSANGSDTYYRLDSNGMPQVMSTADNTQSAGTFPGSGSLPPSAVSILQQNYPLAWADYSISVPPTAPFVLNLANINTTNCPGLGTGTAAFSGRVYISIGIPRLPFTVQANGYTAPVFENPPGYFTLFDWIEFSFDSQQNFNGNTTQVDQFGFELTLNGTPGGSLQGKLNQSRNTILNAFGPCLPAPFGGVLQLAVPPGTEAAYPAGTDFLRVLAPKVVTGPPNYQGPLASYYDTQIATWYKTWQTTPVVTQDQATGYYTGIVPTEGSNAGILTFYAGQSPSGQIAFLLTGTNPATNVILTWDIWQCASTLASGGDAQKNVGKILAAGFNRGVVSNSMSDIGCSQNASSFYPAGGLWNVWAQMFHQFSSNGLAYGFPYDDVCDQNPSISLSGTTAVTITVQKFGA